jgi:hypothetical protein
VTTSKILKRTARFPLLILALLLLVEEWLWERLRSGLRRFLALLPLEQLRASLSRWILGLPPYGSLVLFIIPFLLLLPLKVFGIWCFARGHWLLGACDIVLAKALGMAFTAVIFELTKPKLLQLSWFRNLHTLAINWLTWAHELAAPIRRRLAISLHLLRSESRKRQLFPSAAARKNAAIISRYLRRARAQAKAQSTARARDTASSRHRSG